MRDISHPKMLLIVLVLYLCPVFQCQTEDTELSEDVASEEYTNSDMDPNAVGFFLHFIYENVFLNSHMWALTSLVFVLRLLSESRGR